MNRKEELLQEIKLRRLIKKAIKLKNSKHKKEQFQQKLEETKLRHIIRHLIAEGGVSADTTPMPYESTALSALADAFSQVLPILKTGLRKLKRPEERSSYRAHVLQKFSDMFKTFEGFDSKQAGAIGESDVGEEKPEEDKLKIVLDDPDRVMPSDGKEDYRFKEQSKPELEPDDQDVEDLAIQTEDPTGARFAFNTINNSNIEKLLADTRKLLPREEDKQEFKDYALYNVDLWLLTYEKEISDELGTAPSFNSTVTKKPVGAQVAGSAAEFESGGEEMLPMEDFEDAEEFEEEMEEILMMENIHVGE